MRHFAIRKKTNLLKRRRRPRRRRQSSEPSSGSVPLGHRVVGQTQRSAEVLVVHVQVRSAPGLGVTVVCSIGRFFMHLQRSMSWWVFVDYVTFEANCRDWDKRAIMATVCRSCRVNVVIKMCIIKYYDVITIMYEKRALDLAEWWSLFICFHLFDCLRYVRSQLLFGNTHVFLFKFVMKKFQFEILHNMLMDNPVLLRCSIKILNIFVQSINDSIPHWLGNLVAWFKAYLCIGQCNYLAPIRSFQKLEELNPTLSNGYYVWKK